MIRPLTPLRLGPVADEILQHDGEADVIAVFERSFYLAAPGGILCVGLDVLGDGPLNVLLSGNAAPNWPRLGVTREAKGWVRERHLGIGEEFAVDLAGLTVWHPAAWSNIDETNLRTGIAAARSMAASMCPDDGLSRLVLTPAAKAADRIAAAAAPILAELRRALPQSLATQTPSADLKRAATLLVGLGPGLTPSGDDLLGGLFIALSAHGNVALRDALWSALEPELDLLTAEISAAHLAAAADGLGAAPVHDALAGIIRNDQAALPGHLVALRAVGHSSGFDTLAGILLALEAAVTVAR